MVLQRRWLDVEILGEPSRSCDLFGVTICRIAFRYWEDFLNKRSRTFFGGEDNTQAAVRRSRREGIGSEALHIDLILHG